METAALFTVGAVRNIKVGCVLHALWNQERAKIGMNDKNRFDTDAAIRTAVRALMKIISKEKQTNE